MKTASHLFPEFSPADIQCMQPAMKIGLLATVNPHGLPHITLLSTLMASSPTRMCFGQFTEGLSKSYIQSNPKTGFLVMSLDRNLWRGKAIYTHTVQQTKVTSFCQLTVLIIFV